MGNSGKEFVNFWSWAISKGLMNDNTAKSLAAAAKQVLSIDPDWENKDVSKIDVEDILRRFRNIRNKDFKPESLNVYGRRFKQALEMFLGYTSDPASWKPKIQTRPSSSRKPEAAKSNGVEDSSISQDMPGAGKADTLNLPLIEYPFPLRDNCVVRLKLPPDLKVAEVERLIAFIRTLALDFTLLQHS